MAADKTQNITINYKFNTQDVAGATATLNRANEASNRLQQSAQKAGSAIMQEFQKSNKTILDMQTALTRLKSVIEVTSNPQKLKQLSAEYQNIKRQLDAATKAAFGFNQETKKQESSLASLAGNVKNLYGAVTAVFGASFLRSVVNATLEMSELAGNVEGVERAFNRAFPNSILLLENLRKATHGTVTDFELMQRTLQATNLGVEVSSLPELFEFAAARAQQTGESVDYLVDSIVRGIGRKSPLILDNLGLSAVRLKEKFDGAALASQSIADVTKAVAEIAREEMEKMGGYAENSATKVKQIKTAWEELRISIAKKFESGPVITFFSSVINGLRNIVKGEKELAQEEANRIAAQQVNNFISRKEYTDLKDNQLAQIDLLTQEIIERQRLIRLRELGIKQAQEARQAIVDDLTVINLREATEGLDKQIAAQTESKAILEATIPILLKYIKELQTSATLDIPPSTGIIERKREEIKALQEAIEKTNNISDLGALGTLTSKLEIAQAELGDLLRVYHDIQLKDFLKEIKDEATNATAALTNFDDVIERIADLLSVTDPFAVPPPASIYTPTTWDKLKEDFEDHWRDITQAGIDIQADQLKSMAEAELMNYKLRLNNLREYYDEQMLLAGDNQKAKDQLRLREERETNKLRNEMARKEKQVRKTQVYIDIAAGIAKAFATYPWPYALIPAAFVAAQGASQIAIINRQPTNFAKGVINLKGPGNETSDSIPANLSRGESVMTAWETRVAGDVLREVRAKKLDNRELKRLKEGRLAVASQRFDDSRIIKAIKEIQAPDVLEQSHIAYKVTKYNDGYRKKVRASSMGL